MNRTDRLLFICRLLKARKRATLKELAFECHVSRRTIYRDLTSLAGLSIPIYYDNGYRLSGKASLPPIGLAEEEQELLGFCLKHSPLKRSPHFRRRLKDIEIKILSALPAGGRGKKELGRSLVGPVEKAASLSRHEDRLVADIMKALTRNRTVQISLKKGRRLPEHFRLVNLRIRGKRWSLGVIDTDNNRSTAIALENIAGLRLVGPGALSRPGRRKSASGKRIKI